MASIVVEVRDELIRNHNMRHKKAKDLCKIHANFIQTCWDQEVKVQWIAKGIIEREEGCSSSTQKLLDSTGLSS